MYPVVVVSSLPNYDAGMQVLRAGFGSLMTSRDSKVVSTLIIVGQLFSYI